MTGQKLGHQVKSYEIYINTLEARFHNDPILMKFDQIVCLDNI